MSISKSTKEALAERAGCIILPPPRPAWEADVYPGRRLLRHTDPPCVARLLGPSCVFFGFGPSPECALERLERHITGKARQRRSDPRKPGGESAESVPVLQDDKLDKALVAMREVRAGLGL